jgi:hypothetical protein
VVTSATAAGWRWTDPIGDTHADPVLRGVVPARDRGGRRAHAGTIGYSSITNHDPSG